MTAERKDDRKQLGKLGEEIAEAYLKSLKYRIVERNWRCRAGEMDIVAEHMETLIFIEVRTRRPSGRYGLAKESIDQRKQRKIREVAQYYLHRHHKYEQSLRFDVITVELKNDKLEPQIEHIQGAF